MTKYASFGSVSEGTLRSEDLLSRFARELDSLLHLQVTRFKRARYRKLIREADSMLARGDINSEESASEVVDDLMNALGDFAPPYGYFGTSEGDGASFGFWVSDLDSFDGLRVDDTGDVPHDYQGEVMHVNDHGNMTLYVANGRGKLREVWGLV